METGLARVICRTCQSRYEAGTAFCPTDGTRLEPEAASAPSKTLAGSVLADRYRVTKKLGEGGMGEVYEAQHVYIDKKFAIKLLRPEITTNPEAVARFHQEARSASSIGHENIVSIDDFGRTPDGSVYLAMELLDGESLADRMKKGPPLKFEEYLLVTMQVCAGLAAAHAKGIVHRDMKPANIFLTRKNNVTVAKVLDFGIAKVHGESGQQALTKTGQIFGTPQYMSPEQALGKALDGRSDVYSVGVIMYELATGRVPFEAESFMGILTQHITSKPTPPHEVAPDRGIPPAFETVIAKAMAKDPGERYSGMEELLRELEKLASEVAPVILAQRQSASFPAVFEKLRSASGLMPVGGTPHSGSMTPVVTPLPMPGLPDQTVPQPRTKGGAGLWIGLGAVGLVLAGGAVVFTMMKKAAPRPAPIPSAIVKPEAKSPAGPKLAEIVVDSDPKGAKVFLDGRPVCETPDVVRVDGPKQLLLRRDGSVEKWVTIDPAKDHKVIVKLEPIAKPSSPASSSSSKHGSSSSSSKPSAAAKPVTPLPPPILLAPSGKGAKPASSSKKSEVLDPYQ